MKLNPEQVRHVAKLARLALSAEEEARFGTQLSAVLDAVDQLAQVDTTGVPPMTFPTALPAHGRADVVEGELPTEDALANAPQRVGDSFALPRVIE
jgi:aspartyl-tRNA(Asn)/glutamyl-tRNA(Gln) amidotransferase subunit C